MPRNRKPAGTASPQRTDRNDAAAQGTAVASGQPYGQRQELEQAQAALPVPDEQARWQQALEQGAGMGDQAVGLGAPSGRPGEPVTAGLPMGPGPGPEAVQQHRDPEGIPPELVAAARWLPAAELRAADPRTSSAFRQYVRYVRSQLPADFNFADLEG
jgi:hypothetical protein